MIGFPLDSHVVYDESGIPSYDRAVSSAPLRELIKRLFSDGVMPDSTSMQISAKTGMTLEAHRGFAICNGCMKLLETEEAITIAPADSAYPRIDKIVLRLDDNADARSCEIAVKKGTPSASPKSLDVNRTATIWEIALADVMVKANATAITNADIKDLRYDSSVCGVISSISEFDTSTLYQQVQSDLLGFKENEQAEFMEWFDYIRGQLSMDAAGNLQNQIDVEKARINELVAQKSDEITEEMYLNFSGAMTTCSTIKIASNGMNGVLRIYNLKWTSNQISMYDTIAVFPEELIPLAFNDGQQNVLYEADDIKLIIQGTSLRVFRKTTGTPMSHNIMLTYALKNPVMTELSDIRIDVNGERHESAGDAIRSQIKALSENVGAVANAVDWTDFEWQFNSRIYVSNWNIGHVVDESELIGTSDVLDDGVDKMNVAKGTIVDLRRNTTALSEEANGRGIVLCNEKGEIIDIAPIEEIRKTGLYKAPYDGVMYASIYSGTGGYDILSGNTTSAEIILLEAKINKLMEG